MLTSSRKAKGRNLQNKVRDDLNDLYGQPWFRVAIMGEKGCDVKTDQPFVWAIECKNQEVWNVPAWWEQTKANANNKKPLLIIKKNRAEPLAVVRWEDFKNLLMLENAKK